MAQTQIKKTLDVAPERPEKNESMIQGKGRKDSSQLTRNYGRIAAAVSPWICVQRIDVHGFMSE